MSYREYFDLYLKAQDNINAPYLVISFDTVNSTKLDSIKREQLQYNLMNTMKYIYYKLLELETIKNIDILIKDERFYKPWEERKGITCDFSDPYILGDVIEFTVKRDTITEKEIIELFNEAKNIFEIEEEFHISSAYYETNEYEEGNTKFYRGYCLATLESFHKKQTQDSIKKLKKKLK